MDSRAFHAYTAVAQSGEQAGIGIIFTDARGRVLRRICRVLPDATPDLAAFRGILYAFWNCRRLGTRRVVVHSDNAAVVAQINQTQEVELGLIGPYLQVRALMHAYRSARVEAEQDPGWRQEALALARTALASDSTGGIVEDLPLWAGQERRTGASDTAPRAPAGNSG